MGFVVSFNTCGKLSESLSVLGLSTSDELHLHHRVQELLFPVKTSLKTHLFLWFMVYLCFKTQDNDIWRKVQVIVKHHKTNRGQ